MLSTGRVDWYKFDEGSGIVTSDSAGANPGTLVGNPPPQWIAGHTGPFALALSGNGAFGQDRQSSVDVANSLAPVLGGTASLTAWISPDRTTRVLVSGGTIAALKARRTTLTTFTADGRKLLTTDEFGTRDLTGVMDRQIVLNAHFPELWQAHQSRISRLESIVPLFELGYARSQQARSQVSRPGG